MIELRIFSDALPLAGLSVQNIDDGWAGELIQQGYNPSAYNRLVVRTGATRWNTLTVLVSQQDYNNWMLTLPLDFTTAPVSVKMDERVFTGLVMRPPATTLITHQSGAYMELQLVDHRFHWQDTRFDGGVTYRGFNVTTDEKDRFYDSTVDIVDSPGPPPTHDEVPLTYRQVLETLLGHLSPWVGLDDVFLDPDDLLLDSEVGLRDIVADGMPVAKLIDMVLMAGGWVLTREDWSGAGGPGGDLAYHLRRIETGSFWTGTWLAAWHQALLSGSLWGGWDQLPDVPPPFDPLALGEGWPEAPRYGGGGPPDIGGVGGGGPGSLPSQQDDTGPASDLDWAVRVVNRLNLLDLEYPTEVAVHFPTALEDPSQYDFEHDSDDEAKTYVTRRWHVRLKSDGKPASVVGDNRTVPVYDTQWARYDAGGALINVQELDDRAKLVSEIYFARFNSGVCNLLFENIQRPGFVLCEQHYWIQTFGPDGQLGPFTRLVGSLHDPLFGWSPDRDPLSGCDVLSIGSVRAIPRPDGTVLLDAVPTEASAKRIYLARITGVNPKDEQGNPVPVGFNATYKALAIDTWGAAGGDRITVPKDAVNYDEPNVNVVQAWERPVTPPVPPGHDVRPLNKAPMGPNSLGDLCEIWIDTRPGELPTDPPLIVHKLAAWEQIDPAPCPGVPGPSQPPDPIGEAMALAAVGGM